MRRSGRLPASGARSSRGGERSLVSARSADSVGVDTSGAVRLGVELAPQSMSTAVATELVFPRASAGTEDQSERGAPQRVSPITAREKKRQSIGRGLGAPRFTSCSDPDRCADGPAGQVGAITCTSSHAPLAAISRPEGRCLSPTPYLSSDGVLDLHRGCPMVGPASSRTKSPSGGRLYEAVIAVAG